MASAIFPAGLLDALRQAGRVVFLTGSGVSAESGVPTFRDALTGLWARFRPEELATPEAFQRDPQLVWDWYRERRRQVAAVLPNPAHYAIAALEARLPETLLVTQNVDGLHRRAGSADAVEFHGNLFSNRCRACDHVAPQPDPELAAPPPCPLCGALMGPGVVWFGEAIPALALERAWRAAGEADIILAIGTSGLVTPAAALPDVARQGGALVVEVNLHPTPLSAQADFVMTGPAALTLPALAAAL
ncbi:NAD-dependent deacylase [Thioalkalivibrio sp. XN8]|uniref:NAD-dependent deacylase n=1 Tax=Thioalkalivibrio sp. XN8 TaxID=2712863 RepID=UPI0013EC4168|nr:NAD-dependent deacylase [Thioalkalivibrio sp. XN8]NGP54741.1 NAD-dependent deacylase [Thioalkalivibrio sp. XN8]